MLRLLLFTVLLSIASPVVRPILVVRPMMKESGWISTCDGIGCHGMRTLCATYPTRSPDGTVTHYCYQNI
jgi:hypothetical protein